MSRMERRVLAAAIGYANAYSNKGRYDRTRKPLERLRRIVWELQGHRAARKSGDAL
jgi:hypothetical protein